MSPSPSDPTVNELALQRLTRVIGAEQGARIMRETLAAIDRQVLVSADDLYAFAAALSKRQGVAAAVGAMLGVDAVLRGATSPAGSHR